jgi:transposase
VTGCVSIGRPTKLRDDRGGIFPITRTDVFRVKRFTPGSMRNGRRELIGIATCDVWAHVQRDFVAAGKSWTELTPWALEWLRRIRHVYHVNRERLQHPLDTTQFQEHDTSLRRAVEAMRAEAVAELADPKLRQPCRKVLKSLQEHWTGLVRFVDDPRIPMDNNTSERAGRGPAVARKNFYGSGSFWSGRLAAAVFSLLATLAYWKINPRLWLTWYLENCAAVGGKAPEDIQRFLPWNLSPERRVALSEQAASRSTADTS